MEEFSAAAQEFVEAGGNPMPVVQELAGVLTGKSFEQPTR